MLHKCHSFGKRRPLLQRHTQVFHGPDANIAPLLVAMHSRVVVGLNTQGTEELADVLLWKTLSPLACLQALTSRSSHDGFGEAKNTFSCAGYMQVWDGVTLCSSAFHYSIGESCPECLTPLLSQLCFDGSLGIFICFAIFMAPHWSNYTFLF